MYKVLLNGAVFYDARVDDLALINAVLNREENAAGTFEFIVSPEHPRYSDLESRGLVTVLRDDAILWQGVIVEIQTSLYKEKTIRCDGELVYLNESILRPKHYQGSTLQVFTEFINLHNAQVEPAKRFELGMVTVTGRAINCYSNMESTMQCIKDHCIDTHGGVIRIRYANNKKYIDYLNAEDFRTSNQPIKLGLNIKDYSSNLDNTEICSGVIPLGAKDEQTALEGVETRLTIASVNDGKDYLVKDDSVDKYGYIYKVLEYDDITDPSALKTRGEEFLNITQYENVVISVSAVDLALVDDGVDSFDLSDQIRVISEPHGLNKIFSLTQQTLNLLAPQNDVFTLGKEEKKSISAKTANVSDEIKREIYNAVTPKQIILDTAKNNASALINGNGQNGYVVFHTNENGEPYEILIMNTPSFNTATKVWRWNSNGLGYAKRNSASDPLNFGLAMTIDGAIVADYITAGTLQGVRIIGESGSIGGWTMSNNKLTAGDATLNSNGEITIGGDANTAKLMAISGNRHCLVSPYFIRLGDGDKDDTYITNGYIVLSSDTGYGGVNFYNTRAIFANGRTGGDVTAMITGSNGEVAYTSLRSLSDKRRKKNIKPIDADIVKKLLNLKPVSFSFTHIEDNKKRYGFIAQDMQELGFENLVSEADDGILSFDITGLIAPLVMTAQKQHAEIEELKQQIAEIKEALNG